VVAAVTVGDLSSAVCETLPGMPMPGHMHANHLIQLDAMVCMHVALHWHAGYGNS